MIEKIERLAGPIRQHKLLEEQGCTSEVSRIETVEGTLILKKASQPRYRDWLKKRRRYNAFRNMLRCLDSWDFGRVLETATF
ncbi:hypothetical protein BACI349Y_640054 [Bacillus sp. 349Y]|nr:hypothetical protein BACI349Y_640054 [Bacillus sp. 349Y]